MEWMEPMSSSQNIENYESNADCARLNVDSPHYNDIFSAGMAVYKFHNQRVIFMSSTVPDVSYTQLSATFLGRNTHTPGAYGVAARTNAL